MHNYGKLSCHLLNRVQRMITPAGEPSWMSNSCVELHTAHALCSVYPRAVLEPLVITRSIVSASRSNHRRSPQCSECRRLVMPIGTATGRMWTSTWAPMAGSHGRLGDGRSRCGQREQEFVSFRSKGL